MWIIAIICFVVIVRLLTAPNKPKTNGVKVFFISMLASFFVTKIMDSNKKD